LPFPVWVHFAAGLPTLLILKIIDIFLAYSRIPANMFKEQGILMESKSKRKPISATSVAGTGLASVKQKKDRPSL
jgi:hypothetical protein